VLAPHDFRNLNCRRCLSCAFCHVSSLCFDGAASPLAMDSKCMLFIMLAIHAFYYAWNVCYCFMPSAYFFTTCRNLWFVFVEKIGMIQIAQFGSEFRRFLSVFFRSTASLFPFLLYFVCSQSFTIKFAHKNYPKHGYKSFYASFVQGFAHTPFYNRSDRTFDCGVACF